MPLPCELVSESALPKVTDSLRAGGWEVNENAIGPEDWKIGVRYQALCTLGGERWSVCGQLVPKGAPSDFLLMLQPRPTGFLQWWKGMRAHKVAFARLRDDGLIVGNAYE